jgi:hypothetical protein
MPGVNEAISAGINMGGDFLTSLINTAISFASDAGPFPGAPPIDIPPLGGVMDALAKILYEDVFLAFMQIPTLRAIGVDLPLAGLENLITGLGDFHMFEDWADGADRAYTLSAMMAIRAKIWATRARTTHSIKVSDAAPYIYGERGRGHYGLGSRVGTTVPEYPIPHTVFVERVAKVKDAWDEDGPKPLELSIGFREPKDPALKALDWIREINSGLGSLGIL